MCDTPFLPLPGGCIPEPCPCDVCKRKRENTGDCLPAWYVPPELQGMVGPSAKPPCDIDEMINDFDQMLKSIKPKNQKEETDDAGPCECDDKPKVINVQECIKRLREKSGYKGTTTPKAENLTPKCNEGPQRENFGAFNITMVSAPNRGIPPVGRYPHPNAQMTRGICERTYTHNTQLGRIVFGPGQKTPRDNMGTYGEDDEMCASYACCMADILGIITFIAISLTMFWITISQQIAKLSIRIFHADKNTKIVMLGTCILLLVFIGLHQDCAQNSLSCSKPKPVNVKPFVISPHRRDKIALMPTNKKILSTFQDKAVCNVRKNITVSILDSAKKEIFKTTKEFLVPEIKKSLPEVLVHLRDVILNQY